MAIPPVRFVERAEVLRLVALVTLCGIPRDKRTPDRGAKEPEAQRTVEDAPPHITVMDLSPSGEEERAERCLSAGPRVKGLDAEPRQRLVAQRELPLEERGPLSNAEEL